MDNWKFGKPILEEKPQSEKLFSPMSVGSGGSNFAGSNLSEMVDALSRPQGVFTPTVRSPQSHVASPTRAAGSSLMSIVGGGMPPPSTSAAMPSSSASSVSAGLRSDSGTPQSQQNGGSPLNATLKLDSPTLKTLEENSPGLELSPKRNWDQAVSETDQKQAELTQMQWNLCRDQISAFSQDLMAIRAEVRTVVGRQAELRHMLTMEENQRQESSSKMDNSLKNVQVQMEDTSRIVQMEISGRRDGKDRTSRDMSFLEERLEKASQDFRSNHSMLTQTLDTERQERIQGEERRDERMRAYTSELQRSFDAEVSRIQKLFEEAERKRTLGAGQLSSEVQACTTKLDDLLHDRSATEVSFRKSIQEASDRLRNEVDAAAASLRGNVSEEGTKRKVEMSGMTDSLQRLRVELDREIADRAKGDEQTTALISQLRAELAEGIKARKEGENRLAAEVRESSKAFSRGGDDDTSRQLREVRQLIEQEVKERQMWEEKSAKRLQEFSSMLDGDRKDREEIGQRLQAADVAGRVNTLADALDREVKERVGCHETVVKIANEHRELAVQEAAEHRAAHLDLKTRCEGIAEQHRGELQALASAHERGSNELQAFSVAQERAHNELHAQLGSIRQDKEAQDRGRADLEALTAAQERMRKDVQALSNVHEHEKHELRAQLAQIREQRQTGDSADDAVQKCCVDLRHALDAEVAARTTEGSELQRGLETLRRALEEQARARAGVPKEAAGPRASEAARFEQDLQALKQALEQEVHGRAALHMEVSSGIQRCNQRIEEESSARAFGLADLLDRVNAIPNKLTPEVDGQQNATNKESQEIAAALQDEVQELKRGLQAVVDAQRTAEGLQCDVSALRQALEDEAKERLKNDEEVAKMLREAPKKAPPGNSPSSFSQLALPMSSPLNSARSGTSMGEAQEQLEEWKASMCQAMANVERNLTELIEDETSKRKAALQVEASHRAQGDSDARSKVAEVMEEVKTCRHMLDEESRMRIESSEVTQEAWKAQHEDEVHARVVATVSLQQDLEELRTRAENTIGPKLQAILDREREARVKAYAEFEELRGTVKDERKARELAERGFETMMKGFWKESDGERIVSEVKQSFQMEAEHLWQALDSHTHDVDIGNATASNQLGSTEKDLGKITTPVEMQGVVSRTPQVSPRSNFTAIVKRASVTPQRPARQSSGEAATASRKPSVSPEPSPDRKSGLPGATTIYKGQGRGPTDTPPESRPEPSSTADKIASDQLEPSPSKSVGDAGSGSLSCTVTGLTIPGSPRSVPVTPNPKDLQRLQQILISHSSASNAPSGKASSRQNSQNQRGHRGAQGTSSSTSSRQRQGRDDHSETDSGFGGSTGRSMPNGEAKAAISTSNPSLKMPSAGNPHGTASNRQPPRTSGGSPPPQKVPSGRSGSIRVSTQLGVTPPPPGMRMLIQQYEQNRSALSGPPPSGRPLSSLAAVAVGAAATANSSPTFSWRSTERERGGKPQAHCLPAQYSRFEPTPPRQQVSSPHASSHSSSMANM